MYYSEEIVEEVRSRSEIVDIISGYVKLKKSGSNHMGLCPFHNEKSPSFSVSQSKQMYHCFGCGTGGNVFTFVMNYENYTFVEALKMLAERAGVDLPEVEYTDQMRQKENKRATLLAINKDAANYFFYQLKGENGSLAKEYFIQRKLTEETIKKFGLGFANVSNDDLVQYLRNKGYSDTLIKEAGLASFHEKYGMNDKFWNRVMFPIVDVNHKVIGFGGRVMGEGTPKYLNSPETMIFDKSRNLYGLNFARTSREGYLIICEGYMDVIAMHQAGFTQAVATLGTAFTPGQANLIRRYTDKVYLAYDSDNAGKKATSRAIEILREIDLTVKVISLAPFKDPDEFIRSKGKDAFIGRIEKAENGFLFQVGMIAQQYDLKDPAGLTRFYKEVADEILKLSEEVEREVYIKAIAERYDIGFEGFRTLVYNQALKVGIAKSRVVPKSSVEEKNVPEEAGKKAQRILITWIVDEPALYDKIKKYISPEDFTYPLYKKVVERLFYELEEKKVVVAAIINMFEEEAEQKEAAALFSTKLQEITTKKEREKAFHDILCKVKENSLEYYSRQLGSDISALQLVITAKKALEELSKTHILID